MTLACDNVMVRHGRHDPVPDCWLALPRRWRRSLARCRDLRRNRSWAQDQARKRWPQVLEETAHRLGDNYPYFHPLYAGQMLKPPHPVARAAYALAMKINPNNHARGRRDARARRWKWKRCRRDRRDVRVDRSYLGHLTSSGTFANLEALWVAGQLAPGKRIVGSEQAHYTHQRISGVLKLGIRERRGGRARADGAGCAGRRAAQGRRGHGGGDAGHDGDGRGRSAGRDSGAARSDMDSECMWMRRMAATLG